MSLIKYEGKLLGGEYSIDDKGKATVLINDAKENIPRFCEMMLLCECKEIDVKVVNNEEKFNFNLKFYIPNFMFSGIRPEGEACKIVTSDGIQYYGEYSSRIAFTVATMKELINNCEESKEHRLPYNLGAQAFKMSIDRFVNKCKEAKEIYEENGTLKFNSKFEIETRGKNR